MRSILLLAALLTAGLPASARTIVVQKTGSIRAALAQASAGDRIEVMPGTYREGKATDVIALAITLPGISLVGKPRPGNPVVLENAGDQGFGIWVSPANSVGPGEQGDTEHPPCGEGLQRSTLTGFTLSGFTVRGFGQHGVHLACVDRFSLSDNHADGNSVYGLFPVRSSRGVMAGNVVTNTKTDAGIYVGQSDNVLITGNVVHHNLLGIEVENSRNCAVIGNDAHDNTFGIFVDILPALQSKTQEATLVAFNSVHENNQGNPLQPTELLGLLPPGIGILIAGGDRTTVLMNHVRDNGFVGVAIVSLCLAFQLQFPGQPCPQLDVDPDPDGNRILGNKLFRNGTAPLPPPFDQVPGLNQMKADLFWDGSGHGNCWAGNAFTTSTPSPLPACGH
jgi:parallel beta-helix repeat protein